MALSDLFTVLELYCIAVHGVMLMELNQCKQSCQFSTCIFICLKNKTDLNLFARFFSFWLNWIYTGTTPSLSPSLLLNCFVFP